LLVADIRLDKLVFGVSGEVLEVFQAAGIGQQVEVENKDFGKIGEDVTHEIGADKAGASGDKYS